MASPAELKKLNFERKARLVAMCQKAVDDNDSTPETRNSIDEMKKDIADHDDRIQNLEDAIGLQNADPVSNAVDDDETETKSFTKSFTRSNVVINHARPAGERKGIRAARFILGAGIAEKTGSVAAGAHFVSSRFDDREVEKTVSALAAGAASLGGATIPQAFRNELIELLRSESVVRKSGATIVSSKNGNYTFPRQLTSATAYWVSENTDIPASNPTFDDVQMTAKRLAAVVPVSNVLLRQTDMDMSSIVLDDMMAQLVNTEDLQLLTGTASSAAPGGLMYYTPAANVITAASIAGLSGTNLGTSINLTLMALKGALQYNSIRLDGACWYMHPVVVNYLSSILDGNGQYIFRNELSNNTLMGYTVYTTNELPTNLGASGALGTPIIFAQPKAMLLSESLDMFSTVSDIATYSQNGAYSSAFSKDQTVFRVIESIDFNMKYLNGVAYSVVPWATAGFTPGAGFAYPPTTPLTQASYAPSASEIG